jgi:caffeoyl-CoA O-methyltransferase
MNTSATTATLSHGGAADNPARCAAATCEGSVVDLVDPRIEAYIERMSSPHEPLLAELSAETERTLDRSGMLTGPVAGRFLETLVWIARPLRVLEIGTYSGHSALAMAAALPGGGRIDTCELDPAHAAVAQRYFDASPLGRAITLHLGPALGTIAGLDGELDLVFLDADKDGYVAYYDAVFPRLSERGLIVADNTLAGGRVLDGEGPIHRFNEHVRADPRAACVIVPVRDGMSLIRRRSRSMLPA